MSSLISISKSSEDLPVAPLLVLTRTAIGLGLGILIADKIRPPMRQATAITLIGNRRVGRGAVAGENHRRPDQSSRIRMGQPRPFTFHSRRFRLHLRQRHLLVESVEHSLASACQPIDLVVAAASTAKTYLNLRILRNRLRTRVADLQLCAHVAQFGCLLVYHCSQTPNFRS